MVALVNDSTYNLTRLKLLQGRVASIWAGNFLFDGVHSYPVLPFKYLTSEFTNFEKNIDSKVEMIYHLSGYGTTRDEALRGFLGESAERYSFAVLSQFIQNRLCRKSYQGLVDEFGSESVTPFNCINAYCQRSEPNFVHETDEILWVRMHSFVDPAKPFFAPLQLVVSGGTNIYSEEKAYVPSAVSTGTACHETVSQAMDAALIECLQIDSFELWWYGGLQGKLVDLDQRNFLRSYFDVNSIDQFLQEFTLSFTDITFDKNIYVYVCEIFGKKPNLPRYTVGVQGGYNRERTLYRCLMEALCVLEYNMNLPWINYDKWSSIGRNIKNIKNFDDNITKYAKYGKPHLEVGTSNFVPVELKDSALSYVKKNYPRSGYLVITAPEFEDLNLEVVRACIPELLPLSLPSYPPEHHPRFLSNGGIVNHVAHPLA